MDPIVLTDTDEAPRGGRHLARNVAIAAAIVLIAFIAVLATRKSEDAQQPEARILGQAVPDVQGTTLDGTPYDISTHRGSWVVVNFFAHWCPPCVAEQPELVKFAEEHKAANDVQLVGVAFQDTESDVRNFFATNGGNWPVLVGDTGSIPLAFGVTKVPESYVVSPDGEVVAKFEGVTQAKLDAVIAQFEAQAGTSGNAPAAGEPVTSTAAPERMPGGTLRRWGPWLAMLVILVTALFVGTASQRTTLTNADRLTNIARTIKCPVCSGESVAESNAEISQEIRKDIGQRLEQGQTDDQIREAYRAQYGDYILLTPSASGVTSLVWVLPVVMLVVALAGLVLAFSRWRVRGELHATDADRALVADALDDAPDDGPDPEMGSGR